MTTTEESPTTSLIAALEQGQQAVTRLHATAGQELLYPGHLPTGVWILLEGQVVSLFGGEGGRAHRSLAKPGHPVVIVGLDALGSRGDSLVTTVADSALLHVGLSVCVPGGSLREQVESLEDLLSV